MMPARRARSVWRGVPRQLGAVAQSVGQTRNTNGLTRTGRGSRRKARFIGYRPAAGAVQPAPRRGTYGSQMADYRPPRRVVGERLGHANRDVGAAAVVHDAQLERPAPHAAPRVDFPSRELRGPLHRNAPRLREWPARRPTIPSAVTGTRREPEARDHGRFREACIGWRITTGFPH